MESKPSGQNRPNPRHYDRPTEKREVKGTITVNPVETIFPPDIAKEYIASSKENTARENRRLTVESITLFLVFVVAILNLLQTCSSVNSSNAARDAIAADWQVKMPQIVPSGVEFSPAGVNYVSLTQHINNSGEAAARNLQWEWGWADKPIHNGVYQWRVTAWSGATVTKSQAPFDIRHIDLADAQRGEWYECGHVHYQDQFPVRPELGHGSVEHDGKWCIRIQDFRLDKDGAHWTPSVECVDSQCDNKN